MEEPTWQQVWRVRSQQNTDRSFELLGEYKGTHKGILKLILTGTLVNEPYERNPLVQGTLLHPAKKALGSGMLSFSVCGSNLLVRSILSHVSDPGLKTIPENLLDKHLQNCKKIPKPVSWRGSSVHVPVTASPFPNKPRSKTHLQSGGPDGDFDRCSGEEPRRFST